MEKPKLNYINQDYASILTELMNYVKGGEGSITSRWNNMSEADPMFMMMHLFAAHKDMENYMIDYRLNESFMSTAKERASMVRIANSNGYKIPSYRAASANYLLDSITKDGVELETTNTYVLPDYASFVDAITGSSYVYISPDFIDYVGLWDNMPTLTLYQGVKRTHSFTTTSIEAETRTHIISNQSISIGAAISSAKMVSKLVKTGGTEVQFKEVPNLLEYIGTSLDVYELNVDPQGLTYIKFHQSANINIEANSEFELQYIVSSGSIATSPSILSSTDAYDGVDALVITATIIEESITEGLDPANAYEIKQYFTQYMQNSKALLRLEEVYNYIMNIQTIDSNVAKVSVFDYNNKVIDGELSVLGYTISPTGHSSNALFVIMTDKDNTLIATGTLSGTLSYDISSKVVLPYIYEQSPQISYDSDVTNIDAGLIDVEVNLTTTIADLFSSSLYRSLIRNAVRDYIMSLNVGEHITSANIKLALQSAGISELVTNGLSIYFRDTLGSVSEYITLPNRVAHIAIAYLVSSIFLHDDSFTWETGTPYGE